MAQQTLLPPTNGDGKRESVEDGNELEACQSVCVSVSWRSLSFNFAVEKNYYISLKERV